MGVILSLRNLCRVHQAYMERFNETALNKSDTKQDLEGNHSNHAHIC